MCVLIACGVCVRACVYVCKHAFVIHALIILMSITDISYLIKQLFLYRVQFGPPRYLPGFLRLGYAKLPKSVNIPNKYNKIN